MLPATPQCPEGIGAAFYDLDGTILDLDYVSPRVLDAMRTAHEAGLANVICTGRNLPIVPEVVKGDFIDYYITVNGGQILDADGHHLMSKAIPRATALELAAWLHGRGAALNVLTSTGAYFENRLVSYMTQAVHRIDAASELTDDGLKDEITSQPNKYTLDDITPIIEGVDEKSDFVQKMGVCFDTADDLARDVPVLEARGDLQLAVVSPTEVEITLKGVEKGSGVEWVRDRLGLTRGQLVAFGDSGNDLPMRPHVGTFVAPGNASDEVKAVADVVVDTIWDDGVAKWLEAALRGEAYPA